MYSKIDSLKDPAFDELRRNRTKDGRRQYQTFTIEGEEMIAQAVEAGFTIKAVYSTKPYSKVKANLYELSQGLMSKAFSNETPDVVALAFQKEGFSWSDKKLLLVLDQIQNCNNIGMIFRSAEAFGVDGVIVVPHPNADLYDRTAIKGSMGSFFRVPVCQCSREEAIELLKTNKITIITTAMHAPLALDAMPKKFPAALIVGNETHGISPAFMQNSDTQIRIPMKGKIESLNVVVAASVCLYHLAGK